MTSKGTRLPAGFLDWGTVHSFSPDYGTLMHVCEDDKYIYTGTVKSGNWEIRQWQVSAAECAPATPTPACRKTKGLASRVT
jgi:hypothetical protein